MVIQTLIADDEVLARRKLRQLLSEEPDIKLQARVPPPSKSWS